MSLTKLGGTTMKPQLFVFLLLTSLFSFAEELTPDKQAALTKQIEVVKGWANDKKIVELVKAANSNPQGKDLTQEKWEKLTVLDPIVRGYSKNEAAEILKKNKTAAVAEAFLNTAEGTKVAFLAKTSSWSHKGKAKHEDPMKGKVWIGKVEVDDSTGKTQIQVSVPVEDGGKAIGSLTVGFNVNELK